MAEPKIKYYVELAGEDPVSVQRALEDIVGAILNEMLQPRENGLTMPKTT